MNFEFSTPLRKNAQKNMFYNEVIFFNKVKFPMKY